GPPNRQVEAHEQEEEDRRSARGRDEAERTLPGGGSNALLDHTLKLGTDLHRHVLRETQRLESLRDGGASILCRGWFCLKEVTGSKALHAGVRRFADRSHRLTQRADRLALGERRRGLDGGRQVGVF